MKITKKQLPPEAMEAAENVIKDGFYNGMGTDEIALAAIAAALNAWPEMRHRTWDDVRRCPCLILPLPKGGE
jgi:hypothetical protein